ncbi:DUF72 domain-containing protein [Amnibacterium flavum]|uniref:DUF72 domain-containing protein n=1 Tax=Amnibacterium flavum TaxID=2173173 RepID=A0A2V1HNM3_9MICO|nr:DUF72 domain-containing protein [Amnibacterium flavum]PVZ94233.1 DUF72 domain-containing protein [Amnibacterium flavum]
MSARSRIGISGWRYASWRGDFYPTGLVHRRELEYAAERFDSVEINGTFYSLQRPSSFEQWAEQTPSGFVFGVKGGRYLTHMLRMRNVEAALGNFFGSGVLALGDRLGPVVWQLPARAVFEPEVLDGFLGRLPRTTGAASDLALRHDAKLKHDPVLAMDPGIPIRHALEVRNAGFAEPGSLDILRRHGVALVRSDGAGQWPLLRHDTADFAYVRLHGADELYASGYTDAQSEAWADEVAGLVTGVGDGVERDVYVYFDNDARGRAPWDAEALQARLAARGVGDG